MVDDADGTNSWRTKKAILESLLAIDDIGCFEGLLNRPGGGSLGSILQMKVHRKNCCGEKRSPEAEEEKPRSRSVC